jgi:hypothetical protein
MFGRSGVLFPEFVGSQVAASASSPLVINRPTGTVSGDLLISVMFANGAGTWTGDTGWTEVLDSGLSPSLRVAYKVAGSSEPASYSYVFSNGTPELGGYILAYRNAVYDLIGTETRATSSTSTAVGVTPSGTGRTAIAVSAWTGNFDLNGGPSGWLQRANREGSRPVGYAFTRNVSLGSTGIATTSIFGGTSSNSGVQLLIRRG